MKIDTTTETLTCTGESHWQEKYWLFRISSGTRHQIQPSQMEENGGFEPFFITISTSCFFDPLKYAHSWLPLCCFSNESH